METNIIRFDLSKLMVNEEFAPDTRAEKSERVLDRYEALFKDKTAFEMGFDFVDKSGALYTNESDVRISLSGTAFRLFETDREKQRAGLTRKYNVTVSRVDRRKKTVELNEVSAGAEDYKTAVEEIEKALAGGNSIEVPAYVVGTYKYNREVLLIDILGLGIVGGVRIREWSPCYVTTFNGRYTVGMKINVVITGKNLKYSHSTTSMIYDCSRRLAFKEDPWKDIEKRAPKNSSVKILATDLLEKHFFGKVLGIDEINVFCEYPDNKELKIVPGATYIGYVYNVSEARQNLKCRMLERVYEKTEAV